MRVPPDRSRLLLALLLCCLAASAACAVTADNSRQQEEGGVLAGRMLLQANGDGESFFEYEEQIVPMDLQSPRCGLFPDPGPCNAAIPKWFFSPSALQCQLFAYGGCQGNGNRFDTLEECTGNCTGTAPAPAPPLETPPPPTAPLEAPPPAQEPPAGPNCICTLIYAPVCTTDGRDFGNQCQAECQGATVAKNGTCSGVPPPAAAGGAGHTVPDAPGRKLQAPSTPDAPTSTVPGGSCACIENFAPVCDTTTNTTYENVCRANCDGVTAFEQGACPPGSAAGKGRRLAQSGAPPPGGCPCPRTFAPVCATDPATHMNITFENACQADCVGAPVVNNGSCADPPGVSPPTAAACSCTREFRPVCDTSTNTTYPNPCEARCSGANGTAEGECPGSAAAGGIAAASGNLATVTESGTPPAAPPPPSPAGCFCIAEFAPVCGSDSNTYSNACLAGCANVTVASNGTCSLPASSIGAGNEGNSVQGGTGLPQPAVSPVCLQLRDSGPCLALAYHWYWDATALKCKTFAYGGCQGNGNRFLMRGECEAACRVASEANAAAQQNTLALRVAGCSEEYGVALSVTGAAPAAVIAIFKTFTGHAETGLAAGTNVPGEATFSSLRCGTLPLGLMQSQSFFPRTVRADGTGIAYLSLAPLSKAKTPAACRDTLFVAVDTRNCIATAPVKGE